jgi:hypothetical protein
MENNSQDSLFAKVLQIQTSIICGIIFTTICNWTLKFMDSKLVSKCFGVKKSLLRKQKLKIKRKGHLFLGVLNNVKI